MGRDVTRLTNTLIVTNDQAMTRLTDTYLSQMTRDMTRLSDTFYVTNNQGYDKAN